MNDGKVVNFKFQQGDKVQDKVTKFEGVITCRAEYIDGCIQYLLVPEIDGDGKIQESHYFDEQRLILINIKEHEIETNPTGGPKSNNPPMR